LTLDEISNEYRRSLDGNGLVAYYNFNDLNSSSNGITDQANQDQNGLLINGADINAWGLWDTNALFSDGVNDYIETADDPLDFNTSDFSLSAWVKTPLLESAYIIQSWSSGDAAGYQMFENSSGQLQTYLAGTGGTNNCSAGAGGVISDDKWHHIAATFDRSGNVTVYVDGLPKNSCDISGIGAIANTMATQTYQS